MQINFSIVNIWRQTLSFTRFFRLEKGENLDAEAVYKAFEEMDIDCSKSLDWSEFVVGSS